MLNRLSQCFAGQPARVLACAVLCMVGVDILGCVLCGFTVTGVPSAAGELALLGCLGTAYLWIRGDDRLVEMGSYVGLWVVFSFAAAVLTYLCATWPLPLRDNVFAACDRALHFDLHAFSLALTAHPTLYAILRIDYASLLIQIAASVILFAHLRVPGRNASFLGAAMISLLISAVLAGVLPSLGPSAGVDAAWPAGPPWLADVLGMRAGGHISRSLAQLQGIITFPSYHTVLAILIAWAHRGLRTFWPAAAVNGLMLVSVPPAGNHYLTDMIGGAAVVLVAITVSKQFFFEKKNQKTFARLVDASRTIDT